LERKGDPITVNKEQQYITTNISSVIIPKNSRPNTLYKKVWVLGVGKVNIGGKYPKRLKHTENRTTPSTIKP
jgi:hypothetical protein